MTLPDYYEWSDLLMNESSKKSAESEFFSGIVADLQLKWPSLYAIFSLFVRIDEDIIQQDVLPNNVRSHRHDVIFSKFKTLVQCR